MINDVFNVLHMVNIVAVFKELFAFATSRRGKILAIKCDICVHFALTYVCNQGCHTLRQESQPYFVECRRRVSRTYRF